MTAEPPGQLHTGEPDGGSAGDPARTSRTIRLSDGRLLGFAEYGEAGAPAVMLFHGFPGSRLDAPAFWNAEPHNVRVIAPDRPGTGLSTFQPGRRLIDWADDMRQLADSLRLSRFRVAGFSGGGAYALAAAYGLGDRVIAAASVAGVGPLDTPEALAGMNRSNRMLFGMAKRAPWLLRLLASPNARTHTRKPAATFAKAMAAKSVPAADRAVMRDPRFREISVAAMPEPFRQGVRGFVHEMRMYVEPWGFDPSAIRQPIFFWHGDQDVNVPLALVQRLAGRIPQGSLTVCAGEAHLLLPTHWDAVMTHLLDV
jgi:pimeloyl-ACP methyl ester carboxylesterase